MNELKKRTTIVRSSESFEMEIITEPGHVKNKRMLLFSFAVFSVSASLSHIYTQTHITLVRLSFWLLYCRSAEAIWKVLLQYANNSRQMNFDLRVFLVCDTNEREYLRIEKTISLLIIYKLFKM